MKNDIWRSVANSIVGLSQLGINVGFIGKVNDDDLGIKYEEGLNLKMLVICITKKGRFTNRYCNISNTRFRENYVYFFRTAGRINENDIKKEDIKKVNLYFLKDTFGTKENQKKLLRRQLIIQIRLQCHYQINSV